ncbi:MAG: hypothetical protein QNJ55_31665 [Xenococcus sp. MO_188.B8]|nr:hypothetical protein [Xenococcus sp. MO_188.B8]
MCSKHFLIWYHFNGIDCLTFGDRDRDVELDYLIKMAFIPGFTNAAISAI